MTDFPIPDDVTAPPSFSQKAAVFFSLSINACAHVFILVIMPILGRQLGFSDIQTGMLIGISALLLILTGPIWGIYSDRKGRSSVLIIGLFAAAIFPLVLAGATKYASSAGFSPFLLFCTLLGFRVCQVAASGGIVPATQAWLADTTEPTQRAKAMAFMGMAYGLGSICGAAMAWIGGDSRAVVLVTLSCGLFIAAMLIYAFLHPALPSMPTRGTDHAQHPQNASGFSLRALIPFLIITACGMTVYSFVMQVLPLRLADEFGFTPQSATQQSGKIMMLTLAGMVSMQALVARKLTLPPIQLVLIGGILACISMVAASSVNTVALLSASIVILGMAFGVMGPGTIALVSLCAGKTAQAKAAGINVVSQGIGMAIGPIAGAALYQASAVLPFVVGAVIMTGVLILTLILKRRLTFGN
jgi:MFS family permease